MKKLLFATLCLVGIMFVSIESQAADYNPLGPYRVGATVGVGIPSPVSGQLLFKYKEIVGANLEYGFLPQLTIGEAKIKQHMLDVSLRVYPFKGAFFLGAGLGTQTLSAVASTTQNGVTGDASAEVNTFFLSPRLGFLKKFDFGLAIGMDVGVEIPLSGSANFSSSNSTGVALAPPKAVTDVTDAIKSTPIPIVHLLQLGYIF